MKKIKIFFITTLIATLFSTLCFAVSFEPTQTFETKENDKNYITKVYEVDSENDSLFKTGLTKEFEEGTRKYTLASIDTKGGNLTLTKSETQIKVVETDTDDVSEILKQLPSTIQYDESDGYTGELKLDTDSLITTKVSGGSYRTSYIVRDDVTFSNYSANDLYDIPKTRTKNGANMKLLNVDWKVQSSEYVAGTAVPLTYSGVAHYAVTGYRTVASESKYSTSVEYKGELVKTEVQPITYYVRYVESNNKTVAIILGIVLLGLLVSFCLYFLFNKNLKIYNLQDDRYVLVDKRNFNYSNPIINLNNLSKKSTSNAYRIIFSKRLTKKISGMKIKVVLNSKTSQHFVNSYNEEYILDVAM